MANIVKIGPGKLHWDGKKVLFTVTLDDKSKHKLTAVPGPLADVREYFDHVGAEIDISQEQKARLTVEAKRIRADPEHQAKAALLNQGRAAVNRRSRARHKLSKIRRIAKELMSEYSLSEEQLFQTIRDALVEAVQEM